MADGITLDETLGTITIDVTNATIVAVNEEAVVTLDDDSVEIAVNETSVEIITDTSVVATVVIDEVAEIITVAEQGPQGIPAQGTGPSYVHTQATAQLSWVVVHNLGRNPFVDIQSDDENVIARVSYPNTSSALVEFNSVASGQALCF